MEQESRLERNCLSWWYPRLIASAPSLRMPRTLIREEDGDAAEGFEQAVAAVESCVEELGGCPVFLRTGHTSLKHSWRQTCFLQRIEDLRDQMNRLATYSAFAGIFGLPADVWVVREMIPTSPMKLLPQYSGMPLVREWRVFAKDGEVLCLHPYWPANAIREGGFAITNSELADLWMPRQGQDQQMREMAATASRVLGGSWSVDLLEDRDGKLWLTDMACAEDSWHWTSCKNRAITEEGPGHDG